MSTHERTDGHGQMDGWNERALAYSCTHIVSHAIIISYQYSVVYKCLIIMVESLTIRENSTRRYFNRWQCANMIKHSAAIAHRLSQMYKCSNIHRFRCVTNTRTNSNSHIIYAVKLDEKNNILSKKK